MKRTELEINSSGDEKSEPQLTEPHFDEATIATAVPVEPLPDAEEPGRFGIGARFQRLSAIAWVVIAAILFTVVTIALSVATKLEAPSEPQAAVKPIEPSIQTEIAEGSISPSREPSAVRTGLRPANKSKAKSGKPVARKVATLVYGR